MKIKNISIRLTETGGPSLEIIGSDLDGLYVLKTLLPLALSRFRKTVGKPINVDDLGANISYLVQLLALVVSALEEIKTMPDHVNKETVENAIRVTKRLHEKLLPTAADELRKLTNVFRSARAKCAANGDVAPEWNPERAYEEAVNAGQLNPRS